MSEAIGRVAVPALLLVWPVIAGIATYRRDRRQFRRGLRNVLLFGALLVLFMLVVIAPGMNAGL